MKKETIRVAAILPTARFGVPAALAREHTETARRAYGEGARVIVFPELSLTGATLGDLYLQESLLRSAEAALASYLDGVADLDCVSFPGLPVRVGDRLYLCSAVARGGALVALVPKVLLTREESRVFTPGGTRDIPLTFAGRKTVLSASRLWLFPDLGVKIGLLLGSSPVFSSSLADEISRGLPDLVVCPAADPEYVGKRERRIADLCGYSRDTGASCLLSSAGTGESAGDTVFSGNSLIISGGKAVAERLPFADPAPLIRDIPVGGQITPRKERKPRPALEETTDPHPFIPKKEEDLALILDIQAHALAARLERSHSRTMLLGVSGGLDSTLAALVCARACDLLGRGRDTLIAVTMPCFGTTGRTRSNAERLSEELGARLRTVDIADSVRLHLRDIGHAPDVFDAAYENAQARERMQVLMDLANMEGGFVVGTGDLSEIALGWATYNGDHMSMYSVNAGIPKTLVRVLVSFEADRLAGAGKTALSSVLRDILATPVSPELLPPKDGEIAQCTENIVGPYELHDFFLYHFVKYGIPAKEILSRAKRAFGDTYTDEVLRGWLTVFVRRFFTQAFKRTCLPEGPRVSEITLSPRGGFSMPSDALPDAFLPEV